MTHVEHALDVLKQAKKAKFWSHDLHTQINWALERMRSGNRRRTQSGLRRSLRRERDRLVMNYGHFTVDTEEEHNWEITLDGELLNLVWGTWAHAKDYSQKHHGYPNNGVGLRHDRENCHGCPWEGK